jgi:ABC-type transport system involved in multi-copper enzyme maturation permease subunit
MILGAVCEREMMVVPRTRGLYVARGLAAATLLGIIGTCWLVVTGPQTLVTGGDTARFGATLLRILAPLQLVLAVLAAALVAVLAVGIEKDRRTLELLLVSRLGDAQLVLGKLAGSLLRVGLLLVAAAPMFVIASLFGGVGPEQLGRLFLVTAAAAGAAAAIATMAAFWRDTTFQALAITAFALVGWSAVGEGMAATAGPAAAAVVSPVRAAFDALTPAGGRSLGGFLAVAAGLAAASSGLAVALVRRWNTAAEFRRPAAAGAVGRRDRRREVWANPVLWREICTRAQGRALIVVRLAWVVLFAAAVAGLVAESRAPRPDRFAVAAAVVPMLLASLLAVAAMAVTSITVERDRGTLDLLLVSDLEPGEFVWGKLLGVIAAARELVILPLVVCLGLVPLGLASAEEATYLATGLAVLTCFVTVLGVYAGLSHGLSRRAIAVTLGIVAFLSLGVATAMRIMVAFGGSFELQLAPFLAAIVGGGVGLYAALSARNPSPAVGWASALLPALTFVAITGFLQGSTLQVFLVVAAAYGFATLALLIPSIAAFDLLTGRTAD